jgi:cell division inhibitor SepF
MMSVMNRVWNFFGLQDEESQDQRGRAGEEEHDALEAVPDITRRNRNNVVSIHSQKHVRVVLSEPRSYEEAQEIADHLRSRRPVVINLQRVRSEQAMRIIDFLSGTVYALNGSIAKLGANIFICTPDSVEIHGSITDMLQEATD